MKKLWANKSSKTTKIVIASVALFALVMAIVLSNGFMASTATATIKNLMDKFANAFKAVYAGLLVIVSVIACVIIAWCFITKMISKNPRAIDEANQWMKRTAISWLCFMLINIFVKIGLDIVNDTGADTSNPWEGGGGGAAGGGGGGTP